MKPNYVICPGEVISKTDGRRHYIGPMQLMKLYGVDPRECEIYEPAPWWPTSYYRMAEERQRGLPRLGPRYDGNYELRNSDVSHQVTEKMVDAFIDFADKTTYLSHPSVPYHGTENGDSEGAWRRRVVKAALTAALTVTPRKDKEMIEFCECANYRGLLQVKEEGGKFFWRVACSFEETQWSEIPAELWAVLKKHHDDTADQRKPVEDDEDDEDDR